MSATPLRLLLLTTSYPLRPDAVSGVFIRRLVQALPADIHVEVVAPADTGPCSQPGVHAVRYAPRRLRTLAQGPGGLPAAFKSHPWQLMLLPALLPALMAALLWRSFRRARHADVLHAHWSVCGVLAWPVARHRGLPLITTLRGSDLHLAEKNWLFRVLLRGCVHASDRLVVVGPEMGSTLERLCPTAQGRWVCIPNGVGEEFFALPPPAHADPETPRVLFLGNLTQAKGVHRILDALARLAPERRPGVTIAGAGPERHLLETRCRDAGLASWITFIGVVPPDRVASLLGEHVALLLPSEAEGRPNVVLEAMAAARLVIASRLPAMASLVTHDANGLLFDPADTDDLARCLERVMTHKAETIRLGLAARAHLLGQGLTWTRAATCHAAEYRGMLTPWP